MRPATWLCLFFLLTVAAVAVAEEAEAPCEAGFRTYLDGEFIGIFCAADLDLLPTDVDGGAHTIRFEREGLQPRSFQVAVLGLAPGVETVEPAPDREGRQQRETHAAESLVREEPETRDPEYVPTRKGSLRLTSKPMRCTVRFMGEIKQKTHQRLKVSLIPVGEYPITVAWGGRELSTTIEIKDGQRTIVAASFMKGDEPITVRYEPE